MRHGKLFAYKQRVVRLFNQANYNIVTKICSLPKLQYVNKETYGGGAKCI